MEETNDPAEEEDFIERSKARARAELPKIRTVLVPDKQRRIAMYDSVVANIISIIILYWIARLAGVIPGGAIRAQALGTVGWSALIAAAVAIAFTLVMMNFRPQNRLLNGLLILVVLVAYLALLALVLVAVIIPVLGM
ncbi:MAG: hypothetical protein J0I14_10645 [Propionibacteriaceae bacterium]|nr:hypothetical protein [Propionibacteriaceae bacterium]